MAERGRDTTSASIRLLACRIYRNASPKPMIDIPTRNTLLYDFFAKFLNMMTRQRLLSSILCHFAFALPDGQDCEDTMISLILIYV